MEKYKILAGKPEAKRPVGKSGSRMEDNIWMNIAERGLEVVD
jgi:hypothetical protein